MGQNMKTKKRNMPKVVESKRKKVAPLQNAKNHTKKNGGGCGCNKIMRGGSGRIGKDNFEVVSLDNFDFNKVTISNKVNVDWGNMPSPPDLDCTIL